MADGRSKTADEVVKRQENTQIESKDGSANKFANDGSFMEMFKRRMNEKNATKKESSVPSSCPPSTSSESVGAEARLAPESPSADEPPPTCTVPKQDASKPKELKPLPFVGKRRGAAPVLKTGAVKKQKQTEERAPEKDAWSQYLAEVKKYKEQSCQEENKTRPLVK